LFDANNVKAEFHQPFGCLPQGCFEAAGESITCCEKKRKERKTEMKNIIAKSRD
jgi:hypothetical protein